ncbi:hypothetical protein DL95DRAFT_458864 [Leptodontidium sp. 2 PMI_412]|nr:hypothetical protein DL95DRAFT_458864 [Leptodontidium sp. 2 PMI_412]
MARLTIKAALKLFMFWLDTWSGEFYGLSRVKVTFLNVTNSLNNINHTDFMDITTITMEILCVGNKDVRRHREGERPPGMEITGEDMEDLEKAAREAGLEDDEDEAAPC